MKLSLAALFIGFCIDQLIGDPHSIPHPVAAIGRLISILEKLLRKLFPATKTGEKLAGAVLWIIVAAVSTFLPLLLLLLCSRISPWLRLIAESIMCWQILAVKSLRDETMKVYAALKTGNLEASQFAVSMIVGRDTKRLDAAGVARAAIETVAENSSDGVIAPMLFIIIGGAPLGFFYKAVNTMDSMLGYTDPPYTNIGLVPAKMDDVMNFIPSRLSAGFMLLAGTLMGMDTRGGIRIFLRDRRKHASPNSAQTEAMCAGLMGLRLAGDAWYHGVLHRKQYIGDRVREVEIEDIPRVCRLMYGMSYIALLCFGAVKLLLII